MNKILTVDQAIKEGEKIRREKKSIVLAGGCFDILHIGHITFLEKAKASGDSLFVFLEPDESIKKIKGGGRPINNQENRAKILAALEPVDYVILLPPHLTDIDYDRMIIQLKPAIIATTRGDIHKKNKERQAALIKSKVIEVADYIRDQSTSRLVKLLGNEL